MWGFASICSFSFTFPSSIMIRSIVIILWQLMAIISRTFFIFSFVLLSAFVGILAFVFTTFCAVFISLIVLFLQFLLRQPNQLTCSKQNTHNISESQTHNTISESQTQNNLNESQTQNNLKVRPIASSRLDSLSASSCDAMSIKYPSQPFLLESRGLVGHDTHSIDNLGDKPLSVRSKSATTQKYLLLHLQTPNLAQIPTAELDFSNSIKSRSSRNDLSNIPECFISSIGSADKPNFPSLELDTLHYGARRGQSDCFHAQVENSSLYEDDDGYFNAKMTSALDYLEYPQSVDSSAPSSPLYMSSGPRNHVVLMKRPPKSRNVSGPGSPVSMGNSLVKSFSSFDSRTMMLTPLDIEEHLMD